jgi:hypothetical protein
MEMTQAVALLRVFPSPLLVLKRPGLILPFSEGFRVLGSLLSAACFLCVLDLSLHGGPLRLGLPCPPRELDLVGAGQKPPTSAAMKRLAASETTRT